MRRSRTRIFSSLFLLSDNLNISLLQIKRICLLIADLRYLKMDTKTHTSISFAKAQVCNIFTIRVQQEGGDQKEQHDDLRTKVAKNGDPPLFRG